MREVFQIPYEVLPVDRDSVLTLQKFPPGAKPDRRVASLFRTALELLADTCTASGLFETVSLEEFESIYRGEGLNEQETPVQEITPRASHLALFAVTLGEPVSHKITELFETRDFALGSMLDAAASEAAEKAGDAVERRYLEMLRTSGQADPSVRLLRYSPGYCGWHMSGQKALFRRLRPEEIGITLRESFLMEPLKSMSGVMIGGPAEIHDFEARYPFCAECATWGCRERIRQVLGN